MRLTFHSNIFFENGEKANWEGVIHLLNTEAPYEAEVCARGSSFHLIFGEHSYGRFLCIPNWGIGTELASLNDRFWNFERLQQTTDLSVVDTTSIVDALVKLSNYMH